MKFKLIIIGLLFFSCQGYQDHDAPDYGHDNNSNTMEEIDYYPSMEKAHPRAQELMTEDFFYSPVDETGPFGSDDAADTYAEFAEWRSKNKTANPVTFLPKHLESFGYPPFDLATKDFTTLNSYMDQSELHHRFLTGTDQVILSIAFGQLYLEGEMNDSISILARISIERELIPEMIAMWPDHYQVERKEKLSKMYAVIEKLNE